MGLRCAESCARGPQKSRPATEFTREEVADHSTRDKRVWVTYKDGVYDVTDFLDMHPGGAQRLMLAAGGAIDPFWAMYAQHNTDEVRQMLDGYRIGNLVRWCSFCWPLSGDQAFLVDSIDELGNAVPQVGAGAAQQVDDPYAKEPKRHPALIVRSEQPFNAETPVDVLGTSQLTPNELFYVRNHLPVPHVDPATWSVSI